MIMSKLSCCRLLLLVVIATTACYVSAFSTPPAPLMNSRYTSSIQSPWASSPPVYSVSTRLWDTPSHQQQDEVTRQQDDSSGWNRRRWLQFASHHGKTLAMSAAVIAAATTLWSLPAQAVDLNQLAGGATQTTNRWLSSLSETGFYQAFSLVFLSEIGDKTFFIAGLLAMKTSRFISFVGSMAALAAMTIVSVVIGQLFHAVPSGFGDGLPLDDIAACIAFAFFGIKTLKEAFDMEEGESVMDEELAEAQETVDGSKVETTPWGNLASIFALVFAAEFGDRSFLSTIALSAAQNPVSVAAGAIAAHAAATGIAVSGGAYIAKYISERVIGFIGGTLFLVFAVTTALGIF